MIKKILVSGALAIAGATLTVAGCGSTSTNGGNTGGNDAGNDSSNGGNGNDGSVGNPGDDGGPGFDAANPTLPDGSIYPHGTQLVPGSVSLALDGVTSDDYVIYTDTTTFTAYAIKTTAAAGSTPISLGMVDANNDVSVIGKVVFLGTSSDQNGIGGASVWTSAAAAPATLSASTFSGNGGYYAVSSDGSHVMFLDGINGAETLGSIAVAAPDGTGKTTLVASIDLTDEDCFPQLGFSGTYGVAAYCDVSDAGAIGFDAGFPDGGANPFLATVSSFASATNWTQAPIASGVQDVFTADTAGTTVIVNGASGTSAYGITGGTPVLIDPNGEVGGVTFTPGLLTNDGHILYTTYTHQLERAATTSPPGPTQLAVAGTFSDLYALSPDQAQSWVMGTLNAGQQGGGDLYLASTTVAGTPLTLSAALTAGVSGDPFTADGTHALYFTGQQDGVGTLMAAPVGATDASAAAVLGTNALLDLTTSNAAIVFNQSFSGTTGAADLYTVDTSTAAAPTLLVTQADTTFYLNAERNLIVYTWSYASGASAGLWTLAP